MDAVALKKLYGAIDGMRAEMVLLQKDMVAMPALGPDNDGDGEAAKADFLQKWMSEHVGFDTIERHDASDERVPGGKRPNIVAVMKGASNDRTVWVMGHLDVVPPGDLGKWKTDPWAATEIDGKLYGRGTEDNHHGIVTPLFALKAIKEAGAVLPFDVGLALVADEETGSKYGIQHLIERGGFFRQGDYIVVPDAGEPDGGMIEVAEKSIYWLRIETTGKQCHASTPAAGVNAHYAAAHLITRLNALHEAFPQRDEVFDPPISTFQPTKKEANVPNINTIPGDDVFYLDMRVLPGISLDDVDAEIRKIADGVEKEFGVTVSTTSPQKEVAAPATPADAPVVKALAAAIESVYGIEARPMGIGGGTVAAFFRRAGIGAVVWSKIEDMAHQPNEYTKIENMVGDAKVFAHLFLKG